MTTQPHECDESGRLKPAAQYICELAAWGQKLEARIAELEAVLGALCESFEQRMGDDENADWNPYYNRAQQLLKR